MLCGATVSELLRSGVRHDPSAEIWRCTNCGLVWLWPRPSEQDLERYYATQYRIDYEDPGPEQRFSTDGQEAAARLTRLEPLLDRRVRLLELGSGSGAFLAAARSRVGSIVGMEPEAASRAWIRNSLGLQLVDSLDSLAARMERFDLIVLFHVLEHLPAPIEFLSGLRSLLTETGRVVAEVPNVDDALVSTYRVPSYMEFYFQKAHLLYFSTETLTRSFEAAGFQATVSGIQRYDLSNHLNWMLAGAPGGQAKFADFLGPKVDGAYAAALCGAGLSDTLWAVAQAR